MKIKLSETEKAIILKHDPAVRGRALLELEIVSALIRAMANTDYHFELDVDLDDDISTDNKLKLVLFNLDDATLHVCKFHEHIGWIRLVFGNDGYDLISDYSTSLETLLQPVNDLAKFWGD